jgi:hypothetical protein
MWDYFNFNFDTTMLGFEIHMYILYVWQKQCHYLKSP